MKLKEGFILRTVAGETVVVPTGKDLDGNMLITLNETGAFLWKLLEAGSEEEAMVSALLREYDVDADTAKNHVAAFVSTLRKQGFLQ